MEPAHDEGVGRSQGYHEENGREWTDEVMLGCAQVPEGIYDSLAVEIGEQQQIVFQTVPMVASGGLSRLTDGAGDALHAWFCGG